MSNRITWTRAKLAELKRIYKSAKNTNLEQFEFEGSVIATSYGKYLIEYLESRIR